MLRVDAIRYATRVNRAKSIVAGLTLAAAGCADADSAVRTELVVYAAASTRDALRELATLYESTHPIDLVLCFGASGDLANQIAAAAKADVFLSAGEEEMDRLEDAGLLAAGSRRALLSNQLVVIEPTGAASIFRAPFAAAQLTEPAVRRLSLANVEAVPAGRYAKAWLEEAGIWPSVSVKVLPGVDVRAALAAVESGGADAGIVYRSDAALSPHVRIVHAVPREAGPAIAYPAAAVSGRPAEVQARALLGFLASPQAAAVFERHGFLVPPTPER